MGIEKITSLKGVIKYRGKVYLGTDVKGKEVRRSKTFSKRKDAQVWVNKMFESKGALLTTKEKSFNKIVVIYFKSLIKSKKANTVKNYRTNFNKWIIPYFDYMKIDAIQEIHADKFIQSLHDEGASSDTIRYTANRFKDFLSWCVKKKYIAENPALEIELPQVTLRETKVKFHQIEEVFQLLDYLEDSVYQDFIIFLYSTGLRISEACAVRIEDIDLKSGLIHVTRNLTPYEIQDNEKLDGEFYLGPTKNNQSRSLPLSDEVLGTLRELSQGRKKGEFLFLTERGKARKIIISRGNKQISVNAKIINPREFTSSIFKRYQKKAGLVNILGSHGTRHTFASHYMMNGGDIFTLQKLLGHKDIKSTMVYAHLSPEYLEKSRGLVNFKKSEQFRNIISLRKDNA